MDIVSSQTFSSLSHFTHFSQQPSNCKKQNLVQINVTNKKTELVIKALSI